MTTPASGIEIIGGGLAGLSLGLALRRADVPVTVFEAGDYPRHRVCGEFISGLDEATIDTLGLAPILAGALRPASVGWFVHGRPLRPQRLPAPAYGLSRYTLDGRLATAFVAAGGALRTRTRVTDLTPRPGRVFATGRRRGRPRWIGIKVHAGDLELGQDLEVHLGDGCYVGLCRVEDGSVNVCGLFRQRSVDAHGTGLLDAYAEAGGLPELAERLRRAWLHEETFCGVAALEFDRTVPTTDRICLGDACAVIPPFTGNGMAMAFQSAAAATGPLQRYAQGGIDWVEAVRATNAALRLRFRRRLASAGALHPFLLRPRRQRWLALAARTGLLPFRPMYAFVH